MRWTTGWDCTTTDTGRAKVGNRDPSNPASGVVLVRPFRVDPGKAFWLRPSRAVDDTLPVDKPKERLIVRGTECGLMPWLGGDSFDEGRCRLVLSVARNQEQPENALQNAEEEPWGHEALPTECDGS